MIRNQNFEAISLYTTLLKKFKNRIGKFTKHNTEITQDMIKVLENRLKELRGE